MLSRVRCPVPLIVASVLGLGGLVVMLLASRSAEQLAVLGQPDYHHWAAVSSVRLGFGIAFGVMAGVCFASLLVVNRLAARLRQSEDRITALEAEVKKLREPGHA